MGTSLRASCMLLVVAGCAHSSMRAPSGMRFTPPREHELDTSLVEVARVDPGSDERALLVLFPKSACSGSASAVLVDDEGRFLGAVAPGTGALLTVPLRAVVVALFSSVEVTAPVGTWHDAKRISLPPAPSGVVIRSFRWSARECDSGWSFDVHLANRHELERELTKSEFRWVTPDATDGQAWLDAHRRRVVEVLATPPSRPPGDIRHLVLR